MAATTTFTELSRRGRTRSNGFMRTMLDRMIDARAREARRYVETHMAVYGRDDLADARDSLFEGRGPERR